MLQLVANVPIVFPEMRMLIEEAKTTKQKLRLELLDALKPEATRNLSLQYSIASPLVSGLVCCLGRPSFPEW